MDNMPQDLDSAKKLISTLDDSFEKLIGGANDTLEGIEGLREQLRKHPDRDLVRLIDGPLETLARMVTTDRDFAQFNRDHIQKYGYAG